MVTLGIADYTYAVLEPWAQLQEGWSFCEVAVVGVDAQDHVYAFNRGAHPMVVFDRQGQCLRSWGESGTDPGQCNIVPNIATDREGWVYEADRENH